MKSPTYTLVEVYEVVPANQATLNLYHFDLYRFNDEEEWDATGFRDYFNAESVCVIEWPEKAQNVLPKPDLDIVFTIKHDGECLGRSIKILAHTVLGQQCLKVISTQI